ncbi:synaptobrevin homolog YKT6 [Trichonephila inaurata madagascariensis]|uniref:Synaptobrevin homolog YKT6 n=1 Tax=Trichonephila inaurata madagascariensis TaxID=2747483 RepID=A0A8X6MIE1_9ARAC|nr:synaptobrevin homolog YKT6 [Trichonephila inaurata madagascariensis]
MKQTAFRPSDPAQNNILKFLIGKKTNNSNRISLFLFNTMVKLYHLAVLYRHHSKAISLYTVERCHPASRMSVKEQAYMCHVYVRADSLSAALISDQEYPQRVAHTLLNKILEEFSNKFPPTSWTGEPNSIAFPVLDKYLMDYQNPEQADSITKIHNELDETKIILHDTLQAVLERGEKLDDLVVKSEQLSVQSKAFYKTARKTNSCCVIL